MENKLLTNCPLCIRFFIAKSLLLLAILSLPSSLAGQLQLTVDKNTATYKVGETAIFTVLSNTSGTAEYKIEYDRFTTPIQTGTMNLSAGTPATLPITLNEPGIVHCTFNQGGIFSKATAAFDPFRIEPLEGEPTDFDAFWANAIADLATIPIDPKLNFLSSTSYSTTYRINLATVNNRRVYGYISIPVGAGPFPAILSLPSYGNAANITQSEDFIAERGGAISMTISIHNVEPTQEDPNAYMPDNIADPDEMYFKLALQACVRAVDYIFSRSDFDGEHLGITGVSQGGGLAMMLAGIDERVKLLVQSNPTHCEHSGLRHGRASGFPYYIHESRFEVGTAAHEEATAKAVKYYDAVYFAKRYKGPSLTIISYEDDICPPATTFAAYNQLQDRKVLMHARDLDHNHPNEYWEGRFDFFRQHFPAMRTPPWPWPGTTTGHRADAGADRTITLGNGVPLTASVSKDGIALNNLPVRWEKVTGPGNVNFINAAAYQTNATFSVKGTYVIRFSADDFAKLNTEGKYYTATDHVTITVEDNSSGDITPPMINLSTGQSIVAGPFQVNINFSEPITGLEIADFVITNGSASNLTGSGLNFQITISPAAAGTVSIQLPANKLTDIAGNPNLASNILSVTYEIPDTIPPSITLSTPNNNVSGPFQVNLNFSEAVMGFALSDILVNNGTASNLTGSGQNFNFTVTPLAAGQITIALPANRLTDVAGNPNLASNTLVVIYTIVDNTPPSAILSTTSNSVDGPFQVMLEFSETVTGFVLSDLSMSNGTASALTGSGLNYQFTVSPIADGLVAIQLPSNQLADLSGNQNLASNILFVNFTAPDITPPTVSLSTPSTTVNGAFDVSITVSEQVIGLELADFSITNGAASAWSGSGLNYQFTITPNNSGEVTISLPSNQLTDFAGNANTASNTLIVNYIAPDNIPPAIELSTAQNMVNGNFVVTLEFSEPVSGFGIEDVTVSNGIAMNLTGSGLNFQLTVSPMLAGVVYVQITADRMQDLAGNSNLASNILVVTYEPADNIPPVVELSTADSEVQGTFVVAIKLSEKVEGLDRTDFQIENGLAVQLTGAGLNYELHVNPFIQGIVKVSLPAGRVNDLAGNTNPASNEIQVTFEDDATEILKLDAYLEKREVNLSWATNVDYRTNNYELEKSVDGLNFVSFGQLASKQMFGVLILHEAHDSLPQSGDNYYRIKQNFVDGSSAYSNISKVVIDFDINEFVIYPNPANDQLYLNLRNFKSKLGIIEIYTDLGQPIYQKRIESLPVYPVAVDLENLVDGVYTINFSIKGQQRFSRKFVILKR